MPHKIKVEKEITRPFKVGDLVVARAGRLDQNYVYLLAARPQGSHEAFNYIGYNVNGNSVAMSIGTFPEAHYQLFNGELTLSN